MKISGFTLIRNGSVLGYPFVQAIRSILRLCDEVIVNVPRSTDDTLARVKAIADPKIRILETEWDETDRTDGLVLSHHTNLALEQCTGDWCVYIQADEILHEDSIPSMRAAMIRELPNSRVQGLLVDYTHFYGSYRFYACAHSWYRREVRVVRREPNIRSCGDAQGFRTVAGEKLRVKISGGKYFHYGKALSPDKASAKLRSLTELYYPDESIVEQLSARPPAFYEDDEIVKPFTGTHPQVMQEWIAAADWTYRSRNPFIRFRKGYFWKDVSYRIENLTGLEIGVHKNYRLLR